MALQTLSFLGEANPAILATAAPSESEQEVISFTDSARMEFQAALQLLAERAAFVTAAKGVAIAIAEEGLFRYRVATGSNITEPEMIANTNDENLARCLRELAPVSVPMGVSKFRLVAPVEQNNKAAGFIELTSEHEFSNADIGTIARLAGLAAVALEHLGAAETADAGFWEQLQQPLIPKLWHAPESAAPGLSERHENARSNEVTSQIRLCAGCGFPVSPGRKLCVECEQKPEAVASAATDLFAGQHQASWLSEHGYTVASLLVSALAAAIIFWLRR